MGLMYDFAEVVFDGYVLRGRVPLNGRYKLLVLLCDYELGDVIMCFRSLRCPFCGRVFRSVSSLERHVGRERECRVQYELIKKYVINRYLNDPEPICRELSKARDGSDLPPSLWGVSRYTLYRVKTLCRRNGYL